MSRIVITDPHGCINTLIALVAKLPAGVPITFAGDLIDRGPDSRKVIEFVKNGGYDCVLGNHEVMMLQELKFRTKPDGIEQIYVDYYHGIWQMNGGDRCLESYLIDHEEELDGGEILKHKKHDIKALKEHTSWLQSLPYHRLYEDEVNDNGQALLVTHTTAAEVWGEWAPETSHFKNAVTWDRKSFPKNIAGIYNIFGHTPQKNGITIKSHFACIDRGVYLKRGPYGKLVALQWPEMITFVQENIE